MEHTFEWFKKSEDGFVRTGAIDLCDLPGTWWNYQDYIAPRQVSSVELMTSGTLIKISSPVITLDPYPVETFFKVFKRTSKPTVLEDGIRIHKAFGSFANGGLVNSRLDDWRCSMYEGSWDVAKPDNDENVITIYNSDTGNIDLKALEEYMTGQTLRSIKRTPEEKSAMFRIMYGSTLSGRLRDRFSRPLALITALPDRLDPSDPAVAAIMLGSVRRFKASGKIAYVGSWTYGMTHLFTQDYDVELSVTEAEEETVKVTDGTALSETERAFIRKMVKGL